MNPGFVDKHISVAKFPSAKGFEVSWDKEDNDSEDEEGDDDGSKIYIPANETVKVTLRWTPVATGASFNIREMVTLSDGSHRFILKFVGSYHVKTPKKVRSRPQPNLCCAVALFTSSKRSF